MSTWRSDSIGAHYIMSSCDEEIGIIWHEENARLAAAAPRLLEQCERLYMALRMKEPITNQMLKELYEEIVEAGGKTL